MGDIKAEEEAIEGRINEETLLSVSKERTQVLRL